MSEATLNEDLSDLYETAPCGYLSVSPDGRIVKINRRLCDWLGRDCDGLLGSHLHDILSFGGRIAYETHLAPLLRMQGYVFEIALDILHEDGTKIPVIANAAEKRDSAGGHVFTRLTLFKAVDRRTYERSLLEARIAAEAETKAEKEASVLREQFLAVLGHDLRNPLAAVAAGIAMIGKSEELSDRGQAILEEMRGSIDRAIALIEDILDLARGRLGGGVQVEKQPCELAPVLEQVLAEIRAIAPGHRIESRVEVDGPVICDPVRLGQLASNLLANAVTHGDPSRPIRFEAKTGEDQLVVSIANGGEPIPEEVRDQLFQPFFRGQARPSRNGLGLGLFIASEIARAHGGRIEVSSDDRETCFTFTMPLGGPGSSTDQ